MKRREFMNWVGLGFLASSLPVAIAACQSTASDSGSTTTEPATDTAEETAEETAEIDKTPRDDGFAAVGTVADLDEKGFLSDKSFAPGAVAVIRDPADAAAVIAVGSMCPHQGCNVEWSSEEGLFDCPCHGSQFQSDGSVTNGPATEALSTFDAVIEGDLVLVQTKA